MTTKKILTEYLQVNLEDSIAPGVYKEREECNLLERMLTFQGIKTDYSFLLVTSGYASIFHYHPRKFWVYDVNAFPTISSALNAIGYDYVENRPVSVDEALTFFRQKIDGGKPVLTYHTI